MQSQKILGSLLTRSLSEDERDALLYQLVELNKAGSELVDTIISVSPSNDDSLLLVLGALARNNDAAIQSKVVKELLRRLNVAKSSGDSSDAITSINYALGNTKSRLAIDVLLSSLSNTDVDIQTSVIRGLDVHLDQPEVQQALIILLKTSTEDAVLEEVLTILNDAFSNKVLQNPSKELMNAIVDMTNKLENANLYELVIQYLKVVGTDEAQEMINIIMQQHNYGQVTREHVGDSRIKRGSDWDSRSNSNYDLVASYTQRRNDVVTYPQHKAYLWANSFGVSQLNLGVGVGAFVGAFCSGTTNGLKIFGKAVARINVLKKSYDIAVLEYSDYTSGDYLYHKVYVRLGSNTLKNINQKYDTCLRSQSTLWDHSRTVFDVGISYFVYVATLRFSIRGTATTTGTAGVCVCPLNLQACVNFVPSVSLRITGSGEANLIGVIRGGIDVNADFKYFVEPSACLQGITSSSCTSASITNCLNLHHGYPSSLSIVPWWQHRTWSWSWSRRREWEAARWDFTSGRHLLWSSCNPYIRPCSPT